jgi:hypothetical protein
MLGCVMKMMFSAEWTCRAGKPPLACTHRSLVPTARLSYTLTMYMFISLIVTVPGVYCN